MSFPTLLGLAGTLLLATLAGALAQAARLPLPWMIGPLLATAGCCIAGVPVRASNRLRNVGQWIIGTALGLYFTPAVLALVARLAPAIAVGVLWALLLGYGFYRFLWWSQGAQAGLHRASAFFGAAIGGASEMATLAERHGAQLDRVAAAHSLRVLLVVVIIPFGYQWLGVHGADPALSAVGSVQPPQLALLLAAGAGGALLLRALDAPNPWVLGPLLVTATLTGLELRLSALPRPLSNAAQLLIAVSLGSRFTPQFVHAAPRWLGAVAFGTLAMIVACAGFAWLLAQAAGLHPATLLLGTSPGGIAEMAITASVLGLGVPVVTAFHVVRYIAVLLLTGPLYRWELRRCERPPR